VVLSLFLVSMTPRLVFLDKSEIYPDEITWAVRSRESFLAIKTGNFNYFKTAWWNDKKDTEAINLPSSILSGAFIFFTARNQPTHYSLEILPDYIAARIPNTILAFLLSLVFYLSLLKLTKNKVLSFIFTVIFSLDPIFISLSRWNLADLPLTFYIFLVIASALFIKNNILYSIISGLSLSLASLTKPTGIIAFVPLLFLKPKNFIYSFLFFLIFTNFLWLGNSGNIISRIFSYLNSQYILSGKEFRTFFMGEITNNPPFTYYLIQIIQRVPDYILLIFLFVPFAFKKFKKNIYPIILFIVTYIVIMSLSTKKLGIRYIFPVIPWLYLTAGYIFNIISQKLNKKIITIFYVMILSISVFWTYTYFPDYYLFGNFLSGGPCNMQKNEIIGLCQGAKKSSEYIKDNNPEIKSFAYLGCAKTVLPYYSSAKITTEWEKENIVVIEESFAKLSPNHEAVLYFKSQKPTYIVSSKEVTLAKVYDKRLLNQ